MSFPSILVAALLTFGQVQSPSPSPQGPDDLTAKPAAAAPAQSEPAVVDVGALGISLDKIQKAVTRPAAIKLTEERPVFRLEVFGKNPSIEDILGPDYLRGPVPYSGMTHQEFLNMVTPTDVQGYAAFTNGQGMVVAATSIALQWTLQKAIDKLREARSDRAKEAARKEVDEALEALRKARREAGLPDK